jgi:hypothetical protein
MKKVITGHDGQGKSVFFKVESETVTVGSPIVDWHEIWATHADDKIPVDKSAGKSREQYTADVHNVFPARNQSMFRVLDFKPGDAAEALTPDEFDAFVSLATQVLPVTWSRKTPACTQQTASTMA